MQSSLLHLFNIVLESLVTLRKKKKEINDIKSEKKVGKLSLFANYMIINTKKNPRESRKQLLEPIIKFMEFIHKNLFKANIKIYLFILTTNY